MQMIRLLGELNGRCGRVRRYWSFVAGERVAECESVLYGDDVVKAARAS